MISERLITAPKVIVCSRAKLILLNYVMTTRDITSSLRASCKCSLKEVAFVKRRTQQSFYRLEVDFSRYNIPNFSTNQTKQQSTLRHCLRKPEKTQNFDSRFRFAAFSIWTLSFGSRDNFGQGSVKG